MTDARRAGVVVLVLLLSGGIALSATPSLGAVRVGGVGLAWWYGVVLAPLVGVLVTTAALAGARPLPSMAAWISPALFGALLARVFAGEPGVPLLALLCGVAPLLAVLLPFPPGRRDVAAAGSMLVGAGLGLWASALVAGDLASVLGGERWHGLLAAGALALAAGLAPGGGPLRGVALTLGTLALAAPLLALVALGGPQPWQAWSALASRPALVLSEDGVAANDGVAILVSTTLAFSEPHRVTALSDGVYRVIEGDGGRLAVREWRLARGDALTLRPGDRLALADGVRVRFEPGRRVPGAPESGVAWADPRRGDPVGAVGDGLGLALTLAGGAVALAGRAGGSPRRHVPTPDGRRVLTRALASLRTLLAPWLVVLTTVCWGVYAAFAAPDAAVGTPAVGVLVALPSALPGPPWATLLAAAALTGVAALFVATASALHHRVAALAGPDSVRPVWPALWAATVAVAALGALWPHDAWRAVVLASGFAASVTAPLLAVAGPSARLTGALTGASVFGVLALAGGHQLPWTAVVAYPALVAAPAAWGVAALAGARRRRSRRGRAARAGAESVARRARG